MNALTDGALAGAGDIPTLGPETDKAALNTPPADEQPQTTLPQVKDAIHKQAVIDQKLRAILDEGGPVPRKKVIQVATELVAERVLSAQAMAGFLIDLPEEPDAIREWVEAHAKEAETQLEQLMMLIHGLEAGRQSLIESMTADQMPTEQVQ